MTSIWEFSVKTYFETGVLVLAMYGSNIAVGEWEMSIYCMSYRYPLPCLLYNKVVLLSFSCGFKDLVLCYVCFVIIHVHVKSVKVSYLALQQLVQCCHVKI